ncbi:MAG: glycosyltransferase involved in cell wall biosynthesis [Flavobacteriales bacterium]|jgi:glycosyltransferase involved in cell wall biosynthesis
MQVALLITTKNRKKDLSFTLGKIKHLVNNQSLECIIHDDGSSDGTYEFVKANYPTIIIKRNSFSKGLIYCRNEMLNSTKAEYAISLDDDAHFITKYPLETICNYFESNPKCGLIALRIFWGLSTPVSLTSIELPERVQGFVGCGHVWRMSAWRSIPNYPAWFIFYGEENFASYHLLKKEWQVHYLPELLVHHRVSLKSRKNNSDYTIRLRRSLRAGWFLYFLFDPISFIPKKMAYSLWIQFKLKVFKGDFKALFAIILALFDLVCSMPLILKNRDSLSINEYNDYQELKPTKIYWNP